MDLRVVTDLSELGAGVFVSHSYRDEPRLHEMTRLLPKDCKANVFGRTSEDPRRALSGRLLDAIKACDSVVVFQSEHSLRSKWVQFESRFARGLGKPTFVFVPEGPSFLHDVRPTRFSGVATCWAEEAQSQAESISRWFFEERRFSLGGFSDAENHTEYAHYGNLSSGGPVVAFATARDLEQPSLRRDWFFLEFLQPLGHVSDHDIMNYGITFTDLYLAVLDPVSYDNVPEWFHRMFYSRDQVVDLTDGGRSRPWSWKILDELMVTLHYRYA